MSNPGEATGRTAEPRRTKPRKAHSRTPEELGGGRGTPAKRQMPYARLMEVHAILGGMEDGSSTTQEAIDAALSAFSLWKELPENENYRIMELRSEFVTDSKFALTIIYSR